MVQSLVMAQILPAKSELISLATNKTKDKSKIGASSSKKKKEGFKNKKDAAESSTKSGKKSSGSIGKKKSSNLVIPQLDGGNDKAAASRVRKPIKIKAPPGFECEESFIDIKKDDTLVAKDTANIASHGRTKMASKVRFTMDSPNRAVKSPSEALFKSKQVTKLAKSSNENTDVFSPRKTRAMRKNEPQIAEASKLNSKPVKDTTEVFSPRRLRCRSRSTNDEAISSQSLHVPSQKPNLEKLREDNTKKRASSAKVEVETKKTKVSPHSGKEKRRVDDNEDQVQKKRLKPNNVPMKPQSNKPYGGDSDSEYVGDTDEGELLSKRRLLKKKSKPMPAKNIDRRIMSTDSEADTAHAKSKGIDIWVELYCEKEKRWIAIDIYKEKIDVKYIIKTATHPMVYVFAFNNDNSLKDVSARYCPNLCTTIRKMRVNREYLNTVIQRYQGITTARDIKEDEELNSLQLEKPMPTSIAL